MKHIRRRITQLWSRLRVVAHALHRNRGVLGKAFAKGVAYQVGVVCVGIIYFWWVSRR
ncbi:hypothetical protein ACGFY7_48820 [Streptomyces prunicolor]|uniref:hypothetical protein n=1 Tax=Streptomyces prunicolor TaxID=67348 RepID=UPI003722864D